MTWIKVETCIHEKPEVFAIAEILDCDRDTVVGKLLRVWSWADAHTYATNATSVSTKLVDAVAQRDGFAIAMQKVGWLAQNEDGFSFPNFDRHNGNTAKSRALTAKRVAKHTKQTNASLTLDALAEKRREEKNTNTVDSVFSTNKRKAKWAMPDGVNPDHWQDWMLHRKAKRASNTPTAWAKIEREATNAGLSIATVVQICAERSWVGFESAWVANASNATPRGNATTIEPKREKTVYPRPARSAS